MAQTYKSLAAAIEKGNYQNLYFFYGSDLYLGEVLCDLLQKGVLAEHERDFNLHVLYGSDLADGNELRNILSRYPMMSERQLVILKEGQQFKDWKAVLPLLKEPIKHTVFAVLYAADKIDGRTELARVVKQIDGSLELTTPKESEMPERLAEMARRAGLKLQEPAAHALVAQLGTDLSQCANEFSKLSARFGNGVEITREMVFEYIGINRDYDQDALYTAILQNNSNKLVTILYHYSTHQREHPLPLVLAGLFGFYTGMIQLHKSGSEGNPNDLLRKLRWFPDFAYRKTAIQLIKTGLKHYPLRRLTGICAALAQADLQSKGIGGGSSDFGDVLRELSAHLCD